MDRTHVAGWKQALVVVALSDRKRSLPLVGTQLLVVDLLGTPVVQNGAAPRRRRGSQTPL